METLLGDFNQSDFDKLLAEITALELEQEMSFSDERQKQIEDLKKRIPFEYE